MSEVSEDWVKKQLTDARVRKQVGEAVRSLISELDAHGLPEQGRLKAVEVFSRLAVGHPLVQNKDDRRWVPVTPGRIKVADQVRVRSEAFTGKLGTMHNGREGVVVAIRYGDVIVRMTDGLQPSLDGAHYPPDKLEKLVVR
jgi:hypothetical protein